MTTRSASLLPFPAYTKKFRKFQFDIIIWTQQEIVNCCFFKVRDTQSVIKWRTEARRQSSQPQKEIIGQLISYSRLFLVGKKNLTEVLWSSQSKWCWVDTIPHNRECWYACNVVQVSVKHKTQHKTRGYALELSSIDLSGHESARQWSLGLLKVRDVE